MKSKLLLRTWPIAGFALSIILLSGLSFSALAASTHRPAPSRHLLGYNLTRAGNKNLQDTLINGKVTDEGGKPIVGANVIEKGTNNGYITDKDGNYRLRVKDRSSIILVSYVGHITQELSIGTSTTVKIVMESTSSKLDDVVVVGYGTQKRSEITNAVVQTTGAEIQKSSAISLSNSLSGRLAGVFVNQRSSAPGFDDAEILVRGAKTYRNSSALIVIDGVANVDPDGLSRLDPHDVETISVLKDASAAIYGAQSAGGVILVTTKTRKIRQARFRFLHHTILSNTDDPNQIGRCVSIYRRAQ